MENLQHSAIEKQLKQETGLLKAPLVFEYDNYRSFLRDYYTYQKQNNAAFSLRGFSRRAGFRSPSFYKMLVEGQRNLSDEGVEKFCKAIGFPTVEAEFFRTLVSFNQSETVELKERRARELLKSKAFQHLKPLTKAKFQYWSCWYHIAIRELVSLPGFQEDPKWIAAVLRPTISADEARAALDQLLQLGVIERDAQGKLKLSHGQVTSGDEVVNVSIAQFHREMIQKAKESIDRFEKKDRQVSSITISLSAEGEEHLKMVLHHFRKEILAIANQYPDPTRVCQINFQLFPLTERLPGGKS